MKIPFHRCLMILIIIFLIIVIAGCTEKQAQETEKIEDYPSELGEPSYNISLDEGIRLLEKFVSSDPSTSDITPPIYFALGNDVNEEGKAKGWIFGTIIRNDRFFILVESNRQALVPYKMAIWDNQIDIKKVVSPGMLIANNKRNIMDAFGMGVSVPPLKMELSNDAYTITASKGSVNKILHFYAVNGKPITV